MQENQRKTKEEKDGRGDEKRRRRRRKEVYEKCDCRRGFSGGGGVHKCS